MELRVLVARMARMEAALREIVDAAPEESPDPAEDYASTGDAYNNGHATASLRAASTARLALAADANEAAAAGKLSLLVVRWELRHENDGSDVFFSEDEAIDHVISQLRAEGMSEARLQSRREDLAGSGTCDGMSDSHTFALDSFELPLPATTTGSLNTKLVLGEATKTLFVQCDATSEYGEAPKFARLVVDEALVGRVLAMARRCELDNLSESRTWLCPDSWGGGPEAWDVSLDCEELQVTESAFNLRAIRKHASYEIVTKQVGIDLLMSIAADRTGQTDWFVADEQEDLREAVDQARETEQEAG